MGFVKIESDGYILGVAKVDGNGNITESEYNTIAEHLRNAPTAPDGFQYRLTVGLEWELSEMPVFDPAQEEITDAEALAILLGGAV